MQFQVPQFIEIEDKIFGPLSFRQFMYLIGGAGLAFLVYVIKIPFVIKIIPIAALIALALALAFYKVNNRPFIAVMESAVKYYTGRKLYLWKQSPRQKTDNRPDGVAAVKIGKDLPKMSESKLEDLSWSLDVQKNN